MEVEDVDREESDALCLTTPNETISRSKRLQRSSLGEHARPLVNLLKIVFGDQVTFEGDAAKWRPSPGR